MSIECALCIEVAAVRPSRHVWRAQEREKGVREGAGEKRKVKRLKRARRCFTLLRFVAMIMMMMMMCTAIALFVHNIRFFLFALMCIAKLHSKRCAITINLINCAERTEKKTIFARYV